MPRRISARPSPGGDHRPALHRSPEQGARKPGRSRARSAGSIMSRPRRSRYASTRKRARRRGLRPRRRHIRHFDLEIATACRGESDNGDTSLGARLDARTSMARDIQGEETIELRTDRLPAAPKGGSGESEDRAVVGRGPPEQTASLPPHGRRNTTPLHLVGRSAAPTSKSGR